MTEQTAISVFYSWQSDTDNECNLRAIRHALRLASIDIESDYKDIRIVSDEATRNTPGSPDIPSTILQKISNSDIFVCDVTTINSAFKDIPKKTPNPNVLIELGYAVAILGWDRIIMLFNKAHGKFPEDLPFDLDRRRVSGYSVLTKQDGSGKGLLKQILKDAIAAILDHNPKKNNELKSLSPEDKKRIRDVLKLSEILSTVHIPFLDSFFLDAPKKINQNIIHLWHMFNNVKTSALFHLYDVNAQILVDKVHESWGSCLAFPNNYEPNNNPEFLLFRTNSTYTGRMRAREDLRKITDSVKNLKEYLFKLLDYVREKYLEIDVNEMSYNAFEKWKATTEQA
jgi:hypothetical protein